MTKKLTQQQKAEIYCIKHGHAKYVWQCFGYVHCGRCGSQIGDTLGSMYPMDKVINIACKKKPCEVCDPIRKKLSKLDKKILKRLEKKGVSTDYEEILKGIIFK